MRTTLIFIILLLINNELHSQWMIQQSGTTMPIYDIEFINDKTGWACGDGGYIVKTTNGGVNWIRQSNGVIGNPLFGIHPLDSNIIYAVGLFRTFLKSTNGGESWIALDSGLATSGSYECVFFINENTGWISNFQSGAYGVKKTTNGGVTLELNNLNEYPNDLYFKDSVNGVGVQGSALVFKTLNGGSNWNINQLAGSGNFYRVSFINDFTGFTASTRNVYKTTDFGLTWDSIKRISPLDVSITSIEFSNEMTGWAGSTNYIFGTTNGGIDWNIQLGTGVVYSIYAFNDSLVWACGNGGRIWHTTNGGLSNIKTISNTIPDKFELLQNFPNPFNSATKIKFNIKERDEYKLEIINILGQSVKEIINQEISPGTYEFMFDAFDLNSGVYYIRLSNQEYFKTIKTILVK